MSEGDLPEVGRIYQGEDCQVVYLGEREKVPAQVRRLVSGRLWDKTNYVCLTFKTEEDQSVFSLFGFEFPSRVGDRGITRGHGKYVASHFRNSLTAKEKEYFLILSYFWEELEQSPQTRGGTQ